MKISISTTYIVTSLALATVEHCVAQGAGLRGGGGSDARALDSLAELWLQDKLSQLSSPPDGEFLIQTTSDDSMCLDVFPDNGQNVYLYKCHGGSNQLWSYDKDTKQIKSAKDGKCLDINLETNNLYVYNCHDGWNQKFVVDRDISSEGGTNPNDPGMIQAQNDSQQKWCLDIDCRQGQKHNNIFATTDCHGQSNQWFQFEKVGR